MGIYYKEASAGYSGESVIKTFKDCKVYILDLWQDQTNKSNRDKKDCHKDHDNYVSLSHKNFGSTDHSAKHGHCWYPILHQSILISKTIWIPTNSNDRKIRKEQTMMNKARSCIIWPLNWIIKSVTLIFSKKLKGWFNCQNLLKRWLGSDGDTLFCKPTKPCLGDILTHLGLSSAVILYSYQSFLQI